MSTQRDVYNILARLVERLEATSTHDEASQQIITEARDWLRQHSNRPDAVDVRVLAQDVRDALDALLRALEGGKGQDVLRDARVALSRYVVPAPELSDETLRVQFPPSGGVTLARRGKHFTISDDELEQVRDAVNTRKREVRKLQRRGLL